MTTFATAAKRTVRHALSTSLAFVVLAPLQPAGAQMSLRTAVLLALTNSPRVKLAEDDVRRAQTVVSETKDAFVPSIVANGGAGDSYGITLSVPTILTVNAQSLIYSNAHRFYLRAARVSLQAAQLALTDVRLRVEEDTAVTYLTLDHLTSSAAALQGEYDDTVQLQTIFQRRFDAGLETQMGMNETRREVLAVRLRQLQMDDERAVLKAHLAGLTGQPAATVSTDHSSIPSAALLVAANLQADGSITTASQRSAQANAEARSLHADGDLHYRWRPLISFAAQYGRVSPINDVSDYYNLRGRYNVGFVGVTVQLPILDKANRARATEAVIDAIHAQHDAEQMREQEGEDQLRLVHTLTENSVRLQIAELDASMAEDQLKSTLHLAQSGGDGGAIPNAKDEQNARIRTRQRSLDLLDAQFQVQRTQVYLLRLTAGLDMWLGLPVPAVTSWKP